MADSLYPLKRPQTIGEVLDSAFRIFQRTLVRSLPISVLAMLLAQAPNIYLLGRGRPLHVLGTRDAVWWAVLIASSALVAILNYAMLHRQHALILGRPTGLGDEILGAFRRAPTIIGLILLQLVSTALGVILLVIPALYLTVPLAVSWPIVAIEESRAVDAYKAGLTLSSGNWWRVATTATVAFIVLAVFYGVAALLIGFILQFGRGGDVELIVAASRTMLLAVGALFTPFYSALLIAVYFDLRARADLKKGEDQPPPAPRLEGEVG